MAIHNTAEPCGVFSPKPSMARVKIVGNMIELKSPIAMIAIAATLPEAKSAKTTRTAATAALKVRTVEGHVGVFDYYG